MKILIVSKFFYPRGGAELVAINTRRLLIEHGHEVRVFAMKHEKNIPLPEDGDFAESVEFFGGIGAKLKAVKRMMGKGDVARKARKVLEEFRPDVVHLHNVHSYLSPIVAEIARSMGIRVVWTLHDYKLICPAYSCRRADGAICEDCFGGATRAVVTHRCMKGSLAASLMAWREAVCWSQKRLDRMTDLFIAPSAFMGEKMKAAGYSPEKIAVLCNFADPDKIKMLTATAADTPAKGGYFCYIGRLSHEKGVETMIQAAIEAGVKLKVAGTGPLEQEYRSRYASNPEIEFLGHLDAPAVASLLAGAVASVLPSEWYENNPLGVIESLSTGTPVIGADMGGIPELINRPSPTGSRYGVVFPSRDKEALAEIFRNFNPADYSPELIAREAQADFSTEQHYSELIKLYRAL